MTVADIICGTVFNLRTANQDLASPAPSITFMYLLIGGLSSLSTRPLGHLISTLSIFDALNGPLPSCPTYRIFEQVSGGLIWAEGSLESTVFPNHLCEPRQSITSSSLRTSWVNDRPTRDCACQAVVNTQTV